MRSLYPIIFSLLFAFLTSYIAGKILRSFNIRFFRFERLNLVANKLPFYLLPAIFLWSAGYLFRIHFLKILGASILSIGILISIILIFTVPISMLIHYIHRYQKSQKYIFNHSRRHFIGITATSIPVMALGTAGIGIARSFEDVRVPEIPIMFRNLSGGLNGFRILHLTDLHLGNYFHLSDLERTLLQAEPLKPHMVVLTGDIADDFSLLPDALKLVDQLKVPCNGFVILGNHEYYRGIKQAIKILISGPFPLLINSGIEVVYKNEKIYIAGLDDPRSMHRSNHEFYKKTIDLSMTKSHKRFFSFNILLSHRPRALDSIEGHKVDLVLAGHTHGGQIGFRGKSLLEGISNEPYMWGKYRKGKTQLYTSSGLGHWFPFRFNCPPEAPVIILKKG